MTDKEIIKALKHCYTAQECYLCDYQPSKQDRKGTVGCSLQLMKDALDLIERTKKNEVHYRQKVQNQREIINALQNKIERLQAEIERLKADCDKIAEDYSNLIIEKDKLFDEAEALIKKAKFEAIEDFAEQLKMDVCESEHIAIDNLVKERVRVDEKAF